MAEKQNDKTFEKLVEAGNIVGEVIGVDVFMIKVKGLQPANAHSRVRFDNGVRGYIHHIYEDHAVIMKLDPGALEIGAVCVLEAEGLTASVGKNYIGRVINVFGEPIDGKGPIEPDAEWDIFHPAPMLYERELLDTQLETGITILDIAYSLVRGQRMAVLGDGKVGKTALTTQIAINQKDTDITVIYVLIEKRQRDVAQLVDRLEQNGALNKAIIVVTNTFESLPVTYLAPYIGAAYGEYFWQKCGMDTLVIYDDLTTHAQAYREISLIAGVSPGRDSYPGDMFYTHSSLVERAGRTENNHASQTILPIIYAPDGDITAYLPTNVMSMTDGQWILDMKIFKDTMRPAVSTGLSVTRVGGVGQNKRQKALAANLNKTLSGYRQAEEYIHFGTELSPEAQADYDKGKMLFKVMNQDIGEGYNFADQQFLLDIILGSQPAEIIDIAALKEKVKEYAKQLSEDKELQGNFDELRNKLKAEVTTIDEKKAADIAKAKAAEEQRQKEAEAAQAAMETEDGGESGESTSNEENKEEAKKEGEPEKEKEEAKS